jgi:anaerobic magnesium-protoporphyrin IX monomethyl ester cyclase
VNILLANMPIEFNKRENLEPPLGICYIAANLKDLGGVKVYLKDYEVNPFTDIELKRTLSDLDVDVAGVSFRTASYRSAKEFIKRARAVKKDIFIAAGGHHATAFPAETLLDMGCDAVVVGEGEYAFKELVQRLSDNITLKGLAGVVFKDENSNVIVNGPRRPIEDIDTLPWPARELLDLSSYNVITVLTSRGCPFNCIYCDKGISTRSVKFRSAENIFDEIKHIVRDLGKNKLYVVDDHFFLNKNRLEPILDRMIEEKLPVSWVCQARVDGITEDMLRKAKKAGCEQIMFGIETGDETELAYMRKSATLEEAQRAVGLTKEAGITARTNFMLGFPVSTAQTMRNTIKFAKKIKPDIVRFFAVSPLPNTDLWDDIYGKGRIPDGIRWEEIDFYKPSFDIKNLTRDEVSLYVSAGYWHVLKDDFLKEVTIYLIPNAAKLCWLVFRTGRIRGNISKAFPRSVNLIMDNLHQMRGKKLREVVAFLKKVNSLERSL